MTLVDISLLSRFKDADRIASSLPALPALPKGSVAYWEVARITERATGSCPGSVSVVLGIRDRG